MLYASSVINHLKTIVDDLEFPLPQVKKNHIFPTQRLKMPLSHPLILVGIQVFQYPPILFIVGTGVAFAPTSLGVALAPTEGGGRGAADPGGGANVTQLGFAWQVQ